MKKLIYLSIASLTFATQGIALADQGKPLSEEEYTIVLSAICNNSLNASEIREEIADRVAVFSSSRRTVAKLQAIAAGMQEMPPEEKVIICEAI